MKKIDLTGNQYGRLTVLGPAEGKCRGHTYWLCRCQCGKEIVVDGSHLKNGHTKSCGCYREEAPQRSAKDLTGRRFGRLTVLEPADGKDRKYWKCRCDCGKIIVCFKEYLCAGNTQSCGCLQEETRKNNMKKAIHFVDNTCIERIASRRQASNNTSGRRGVYKCGTRWRACIGFKGKLHNLGTYDSFEQAVNAREAAEKALFDSFLQDYYGSGEK